MGLCGPNISNWLIVDVACVISQNFVSVPIHTNADVSMVTQIANVTDMACVVGTWEWCARMVLPNLERMPNLKWIFVMDEANPKGTITLTLLFF